MASRTLLALSLLAGGCTCAATHVADSGAGIDGGRDAAAPIVDAGSDAGFDAAPPPDAAPVTNCFEAVHSFEGVPCTFAGSCLAGDLCCSAGATCWDGRVSWAYAETDCAGMPRPRDCVAEPGRVSGDTPLGAVDLGHAFVSFTFAFAVDVVILFTAEPDLVTCGGDRFTVWLTPGSDPATGEPTYVGTHDAVAQLVLGGELARAPAVVEITRYEGASAAAPNGAIAGTIRVDAPGWNLRGDVDARGCDDLDRSGP